MANATSRGRCPCELDISGAGVGGATSTTLRSDDDVLDDSSGRAEGVAFDTGTDEVEMWRVLLKRSNKSWSMFMGVCSVSDALSKPVGGGSKTGKEGDCEFVSSRILQDTQSILQDKACKVQWCQDKGKGTG